MPNQKRQGRKFQNWNYRELQRINSEKRCKLKPADLKWLKDNGYKNLGWDNVIALYQKIAEFLEQYEIEELSLEELFLEADRIGNKYLTPQEVEEFNQKMAQKTHEISELIDQQFPDTETEALDFRSPVQPAKKKTNQKIYKTIKSS